MGRNELRRKQRLALELLDQANAAFARLKQDPQAWAEELAERALWESTLLDGLADNYPPIRCTNAS
jgi:hypothetical protein